VIACVGETLEEREAGSTMDVVAAQTKAIAGMYIVKHLISFCYLSSFSFTVRPVLMIVMPVSTHYTPLVCDSNPTEIFVG